MQWSGKVPSTGLTPAMRKGKEQAQLAEGVLADLATNPAFQVRTVDGTRWICPYSGALVPCGADPALAARTHLFSRTPWNTRRGGKPRPLAQVLIQKWTHHLIAAGDPRLLAFDAAGRWTNPCTGEAVLLPHARAAGDATAIAEIARALAACPLADTLGSPTC